MSTRHFRSDFEDVDDATYRMLHSRFCRVAQHGNRHEPLRHHRRDPHETAGANQRVRRQKDRHYE